MASLAKCPTSSKPARKSLMLREIEAHNQSPEPKSDRQIEALYGLTDAIGFRFHHTLAKPKALIFIPFFRGENKREGIKSSR